MRKLCFRFITTCVVGIATERGRSDGANSGQARTRPASRGRSFRLDQPCSCLAIRYLHHSRALTHLNLFHNSNSSISSSLIHHRKLSLSQSTQLVSITAIISAHHHQSINQLTPLTSTTQTAAIMRPSTLFTTLSIISAALADVTLTVTVTGNAPCNANPGMP